MNIEMIRKMSAGKVSSKDARVVIERAYFDQKIAERAAQGYSKSVQSFDIVDNEHELDGLITGLEDEGFDVSAKYSPEHFVLGGKRSGSITITVKW